MNRAVVVIVALVGIVACAYVLNGDGGDDADPGYGSTLVPPAVDAPDLGEVQYAGTVDGSHTYIAVPVEGVFIGWFLDGHLLSTSHALTRASFDGVTASFARSEVKTLTYAWDCPTFGSDGEVTDVHIPMTFTLEMDRTAYSVGIEVDEGRNATWDEPMPVHRLRDDAVVDAIVDHLRPVVENLTTVQKSHVLNAFVQDVVSYHSDRDLYDRMEWWTTVSETMFLGKGDCEDSATLFVNLAVRLGMGAGYVAFDDPVMGHMSAAVAVGDADVGDMTSFVMDGVRYVYVETADSGSRIPLGYLTPAFDIEDGKFVAVSYSDGQYIGGETRPIGVTYTGTFVSVYGTGGGTMRT